MADNGCRKVYAKRLSPNDNSKNQVYLGGSFDVLNILPIKEIFSDNEGDWKRTRFKTKLDFKWIDEEGKLILAPEAQLILYPKYPEVRFSGFLKGTKNAPSELMNSRIDRRLLFFGISDSGQIIGFVTEPESELYNEFHSLSDLPEIGVFKEITLQGVELRIDSKTELLNELRRIHKLGWIKSKRLDKSGKILACEATNCGGYTLEAELGIIPNGNSDPDYLGWEIKQFSVKNFQKYNSSIITLMTPEPTNGFYVQEGIESFIRKYGYKDKRGREERLNFGGLHKYEMTTASTNLKLVIEGYDILSQKITNTDGFVGLIDKDENIASSWSFSSLMAHWNKKHAKACYVPSKTKKEQNAFFNGKQYLYGETILLGMRTDFSFLLKEMSSGNIYYDPGIKLELEIPGKRKQNIKRRSQFRIKSGNVGNLYKNYEILDLNKPDKEIYNGSKIEGLED